MEDDIAGRLQRHKAFWHRESVDRPLIAVQKFNPLAFKQVPLADAAWAGGQAVRLQPQMLDVAKFANVEYWFSNPGQLTLGDWFSVRGPYVRVPWMEAILGCPIYSDRDSGSMWSEPFLSSPTEWQGFTLTEDNPWFAKMLEFTRYLVEHNDGSYLVGQTLMRGPIDMLRCFFGDQETCLALLDYPDETHAILEATTDAFIAVAKANQALIPPFHGGYCSYFGIWAPGTVVRTQCDMSALLSAKMYKERVVPFEEKVSRPFQYSVIHLHSGFLHTVDALLEVELPGAIEFALDTGSTPVSTRDLVAVARKVLARKPLIIEGNMTAADCEYLVANLPARGLALSPMIDAAELAAWKPSFA
ncbi:MAG: uroporphyrinogen decarboxylase/cobalamine-independent methonine synthase family protein [Chloroflexota bacterium]